MKPTVRVVIILCLFGAAHWQLRAASQIPAWGNGVAPFASHSSATCLTVPRWSRASSVW